MNFFSAKPTSKDFELNLSRSGEAFEDILELTVNYLTLMACLGQKKYAGEDYQTVKHFEQNPHNYLAINDLPMEWATVPDALKKHNGIGMLIPNNSLILLDSNILYPTVYLKEASDAEYGYGKRMPSVNDVDNLFVIAEESLNVGVTQSVKNVSPNGVHSKIDQMSESVKVQKTELFSDQVSQTQKGHKVNTILGREGDKTTNEKYLKLDYYDYYNLNNVNEQAANKGKLIIVMPYVSATNDILGQITFSGQDGNTDPSIIMTTT